MNLLGKEATKQLMADPRFPRSIVCAVTSAADYEEFRMMLVELSSGELYLIEGGHCSCYHWDEVEWDANEYESSKEILKQADEWLKLDTRWDDVRVKMGHLIKYYFGDENNG